MRWSSESFQQLCIMVSLTIGIIMGYCILMINCLAVRPSHTHKVIPRRESRISWLFRVESANAVQSMSWKSQSNVLANLLKPEQVGLCVSCTWEMGGSGNACLQPRNAAAPWAALKGFIANSHGRRRWFSCSTLLLWYPSCSTVPDSGTPNTRKTCRVRVDDQFAGEMWKTKLVFLALKAMEAVISISIWRTPYILLMDPKSKADAHSVGVLPIWYHKWSVLESYSGLTLA